MSKILAQNYVIDTYPKSCSECPFLTSYDYQCHNEHGRAFGCRLGYMDGGDTRDFPVSSRRWRDCDIEHNMYVDTPMD